MQHPPPFWAAAAVAEYVRGQASWRRTQAARFPDDERNLRSAAALDELALYIENLPDSDRHLIELVDLDAFDDQDRLVAGEDARRAIARWGFDKATSLMRPRDVLQDLVAITRRARRMPAQKRKPEMTAAIQPAPALPGVLWFDDHSSHARHAASRQLGPDRVLTFCGKATDPRRATTEGAAAWNIPEPACSVCAAALERIAETSTGSSLNADRVTEAMRKYIDDIFSHAIYHDRAVERIYDGILEILDREPSKPGVLSEDDSFKLRNLASDLRLAVGEVCAAVTPVAVRRATAIVEATGGHYGDTILNLDRDEAIDYARRLFAEAGVSERFVDELTDDDQRSPAPRDSFSATQQLIDLANKGDQQAIGQLKLHPALAFFDEVTGRAISMERIPAKPREDLLLGILADITAGTIKGERFLAVDVASMGHVRQITIAGAGAAQVSYDASLSDLEHLAKEGYLETAPKGRSLDVTVLEKAWKYRDWLRTMKLAESGKDSQGR